MDNIHIVTFCVTKSDDYSFRKGNLRLVDQINILFESARQRNNNVSFSIITDAKTDLKDVSHPFLRYEFPVNFEQLMLDRTRAQRAYLNEYGLTQKKIVFLDTDMIIARKLSDLYAGDFDVAVTWRSSINMPLNGGIIFVDTTKFYAAQRFFERFESEYMSAMMKVKQWYGDQLILRDLLTLPGKELKEDQLLVVDGVRCQLLDSARYNFTPKKLSFALSRNEKAAYVFHFKGTSIRFMKYYWTFLLNMKRKKHWYDNIEIAKFIVVLRAKRIYSKVILKQKR